MKLGVCIKFSVSLDRLCGTQRPSVTHAAPRKATRRHICPPSPLGLLAGLLAALFGGLFGFQHGEQWVFGGGKHDVLPPHIQG